MLLVLFVTMTGFDSKIMVGYLGWVQSQVGTINIYPIKDKI